jgi:hypothetical protein
LSSLHYCPTIRGNARQTAPAGEERIARNIAQLLKPPRTNQRQADCQHQVRAAMVTAEVVLPKSFPNAIIPDHCSGNSAH